MPGFYGRAFSLLLALMFLFYYYIYYERNLSYFKLAFRFLVLPLIIIIIFFTNDSKAEDCPSACGCNGPNEYCLNHHSRARALRWKP
jgi:hypothetical protein